MWGIYMGIVNPVLQTPMNHLMYILYTVNFSIVRVVQIGGKLYFSKFQGLNTILQ